ncbi:ParB N-terminal domain-containing protein [Patescibacteria group bacterium]
MNYQIKLISISRLKPHEEVNPVNLQHVKKQIKKSKCFIEPIIVDRTNFIILDGHHRTKSLIQLGYKKIPAVLVDYESENIKVYPRRKEIPVNKKKIINQALQKKLFPFKTSKHIITIRQKSYRIDLEKLK